MNRIIVILLVSVCLCAIILVGLSNFKEPKTVVALAPDNGLLAPANTSGTLGSSEPVQGTGAGLTPNGLSPAVVQDVLAASEGNNQPRVNPIDMTPRTNTQNPAPVNRNPSTNENVGSGSNGANSAFIPNTPPSMTGSPITPPVSTNPVVVTQPDTTPPIQSGGQVVVMNQPGATVLTPPATNPPATGTASQPIQQPLVQQPQIVVQTTPPAVTPPAVQPKPAQVAGNNASATVKGSANIRVRFDGSTAILVLSGDKPFEYKSSQLGGPDRLLLDIAGNWQLKSPSVPSNRLFNAVRVGQHSNSTRIVVDLKVKPASWSVVRVSDSVIELHAR